MTCNSGGAEGSDSYWESFSEKYGIKIQAFTYKTKGHKSANKVEISEDDFKEGILKIRDANTILKRRGIDKYMNLLARNWAQVKYSGEIFAIGFIDDFKKGILSGGTGWAVMMTIQAGKPLFVFDQNLKSWFKWSYTVEQFIKVDVPIISCENFAGIGTRKITEEGIQAIENVLIKTFKNKL